MRIYYVCECCEEIFNLVEVEGGEGAAETRGICEDCAVEMGFWDDSSLPSRTFLFS